MRRIKNGKKVTKEELIIALLKSESSAEKRNFEKRFINNNTDDDTYDDKIRGKICDINIIFNRLGKLVTNNDRKKITKDLYEIEKKKNLSDKEREEIFDHLVKLVKTLNKKEKYQYHDYDDWNFYRIKDMENLFGNAVVDDDYYKPILIKSSFNYSYKYYESRGDKGKCHI